MRETPFSGYPFKLDESLSGQAMRAHRERVIEQLSEAMRPLQEKMQRDHEEYMERLWSGFTIKQIRDQITAKGGK